MDKPSIFICSSSAGKNIADAIQENLASEFSVEVWDQGAFGLGEHFQETIKEVSTRVDFAIIVLTPDGLMEQDSTLQPSFVNSMQDRTGFSPSMSISGNVAVTDIPTTRQMVPRDNVIFELGVFVALLGQHRTFIVHEDLQNLRLPDYIKGISTGRYLKSNSRDITIALGPVCNRIRRAVNKIRPSNTRALVLKALMVVSHALCNPLNPGSARLRAFIFKKTDSRLICSHYWAPYAVDECEGAISFEINPETEKQIAVVKAAQKRKVCAVSVSVLPVNLDGVLGEVDKDLCYILAAPILSPEGEVWGTVDFDASSKEGEEILQSRMAQYVLMELGRLLYPILSRQCRFLA